MARFSNPFIQILNGNGKPLTGAKLYFYEPGTTTLKDTYSDSALSIANTNPVIADGSGRFGDIFLSGTYKTELKDSTDVTIDTADPVGGVSDGAFSLWVNDNTYNIPDIVVGSDNLFYKALTNSNQGNDPTSSPANWKAIYFSSTADSTIVKTTDIGATVQAYDADLDTVAANGVGTGNNQIVQLDATAKLPAIDGSQLTNLPSQGLGEGQTWKNMLSSRTNNTNVTNATGRTIMVTASTGITANHSLYGYIDDILNCHMGLDIGASIYNSLTLTVPAGSTYRFNSTANNITTWMELR